MNKTTEKKWKHWLLFSLISLAGTVLSSIVLAESGEDEPLGYAIKGDKESPNVLYFTPWRSPSPPSKIAIPLPELNSLQAIDRDTFLREQHYFNKLHGKTK